MYRYLYFTVFEPLIVDVFRKLLIFLFLSELLEEHFWAFQIVLSYLIKQPMISSMFIVLYISHVMWLEDLWYQ